MDQPRTRARRSPLNAIITVGLALLIGVASPTAVLGATRSIPLFQATQSESLTDLIVEVQTLPPSQERLLRLSPDGSAIVSERHTEGDTYLCVVDVLSMTDRTCANLSSHHIRAFAWHSVAWSPDSSQIAFNEDAFSYLSDSDIWILDVASGELLNLTDEGDRPRVSRVVIGAEQLNDGEEIYLDIVPAWSSDGSEIAFSRSLVTNQGWAGTTIQRVRVNQDGTAVGDPETVTEISSELPGAVHTPIRWTANGQEIVYTVAHMEQGHPDNGLWAVQASGQAEPRLIAARTAPDRDFPILMELRGDPGVAVVTDRTARESAFQFEPVGPRIFVIDLETGNSEPLLLDPATVTHEGRNFAEHVALSPDGRRVVQTRDFGATHRVTIRDLETDVQIGLDLELDDEMPIYSATLIYLLDWADDGTVFLPFPRSQGGLLVKIAG